MKLQFKRISDYCIQLETYTIAKVKVDGKWWFEIWNVNKYIKRFDDPEDAKKYLLNIVKGY